ncbi:MAG: single-strand binding protein [Phycisphaerales bacterium]|nr:single-strand binding protein [Phycisphaerales bacterium]
MASFNQVILLGNLTRDPQLKYLPSQTAVAEFGIACNRKFKTQSGEDKEEVTFVDCSAFGKTGELINQYFTKGKPIFIQGRLKYDSWEDKQGGGKRSKMTVIVENFQFIGSRDGGGGGGGGGGGASHEGGEYEQRPPRPQQQGRPQQSRPQNAPPPQQPFGEEEQFKEDDIPF